MADRVAIEMSAMMPCRRRWAVSRHLMVPPGRQMSGRPPDPNGKAAVGGNHDGQGKAVQRGADAAIIARLSPSVSEIQPTDVFHRIEVQP